MKKLIVIMSLVSAIPAIGMDVSPREQSKQKDTKKNSLLKNQCIDEFKKYLLDPADNNYPFSKDPIPPIVKDAFSICNDLANNPIPGKDRCEKFFKSLNNCYRDGEYAQKCKEVIDTLPPFNSKRSNLLRQFFDHDSSYTFRQVGIKTQAEEIVQARLNRLERKMRKMQDLE